MRVVRPCRSHNTLCRDDETRAPAAGAGCRQRVCRVRRMRVRAERGVPVGQAGPDGAGQRHGAPVRAGEQPRVPHEDLERRHVHGHTEVQAGRAGDAVQESRGRRASVPDAWHAEGGQLFRRAERQGHRDRPLGTAVDAGRGRGVRSAAAAGRPHVRPKTVRGGHPDGHGGQVRRVAQLHVLGAQRAQRHLAGPENADGHRGRRGPRAGVHRVQYANRDLQEVPVQRAGRRVG